MKVLSLCQTEISCWMGEAYLHSNEYIISIQKHSESTNLCQGPNDPQSSTSKFNGVSISHHPSPHQVSRKSIDIFGQILVLKNNKQNN